MSENQSVHAAALRPYTEAGRQVVPLDTRLRRR